MNSYMEHNLDTPLDLVLLAMQDRITKKSTYFGIPTLKNPNDLWVYQEIIVSARPDVIVEIGNYRGGSTLYLAHLCDLIGTGRIIAVDIDHSRIPDNVKQHPRITFLEGDAAERYDAVARLIAEDETVLVLEDSSHTYENTLKVLQRYSALVRPGGFFIVEDSICHHGLDTGPFPGPYEAIRDFVAQNKEFIVERNREFPITWNPLGYLRRRAPGLPRPEDGDGGSGGQAAGRRRSVRELMRPFLPPVLYRATKRRRL